MSDPLKDLMKTMASMPKDPFAGKFVIIPAERITRTVEVKETNADGEEITTTKTESYLLALPAFRRIETEMRTNRIDYQLSEHAPQKDKDGKLCVFVMDKTRPCPIRF